MDPAYLNYLSQMQGWQAQQQGQNNTAQTNLLLQLLQNSGNQQINAFQANQNMLGGLFNTLNNTLGADTKDINGYGQSMLDQAKNLYNTGVSDLASRGMSGSTQKLNNVGAYTQNLNQINDSLARGRIDVRDRGVGNISNMLQSVNNNYPNTSNITGLLGQFGASGGMLSGGGLPAMGGGQMASGGGAGMPSPLGFPGSTMPPQAPKSPYAGNPIMTQQMTAPPTYRPTTMPDQNQGTGWMRPASYQPQQAQQMAAQGYQGLGNGNYERSGSDGMAGSNSYNGRIPNQIISGQPPAGTNVIQGNNQYLANPQDNSGDLRDIFGSMMQDYVRRQQGGPYSQNSYSGAQQPFYPAPGSNPAWQARQAQLAQKRQALMPSMPPMFNNPPMGHLEQAQNPYGFGGPAMSNGYPMSRTPYQAANSNPWMQGGY